jgi:hypothetical protein
MTRGICSPGIYAGAGLTNQETKNQWLEYGTNTLTDGHSFKVSVLFPANKSVIVCPL